MLQMKLLKKIFKIGKISLNKTEKHLNWTLEMKKREILSKQEIRLKLKKIYFYKKLIKKHNN